MISFAQFEQLASTYSVIALERTIPADLHTPVSIYLALREGANHSFLLESVETNEQIGRYSFGGANPSILVVSKGSRIEVTRNGIVHAETGDVVTVLQKLLSEFKQAPLADPSGFSGGFLGYLSYDSLAAIESIALPPEGPSSKPDAIFGLFHSFVRLDHRRHTLTAVHNVVLESHRSFQEQYNEGKHRLDALIQQLSKIPPAPDTFACDFSSLRESNSRDTYCEMVRKAKHYIIEGDIFQVVLSRRTTFQYAGDPFPVYRALRIINPSPYLFYLHFDEIRLIGSSPEVLVRVNDKIVEVLPIAGTRRRGNSEEEDRVLEAELLADEKERAEHAMLIDLGRNDVGRVSEFGSVRVPVQSRVDRFSHVMHMVSEVRGTLKSGCSSLDALVACCPAGTVSGAPKIRAMEIISELEGVRRGVYAGAVGYLGLNGSVDTCIAIRTMICSPAGLEIQAGAGIVADSVPEREFEETENKARALRLAVDMAAKGLQSDDFQRMLEERRL
jgi:anthranilate synthase component I